MPGKTLSRKLAAARQQRTAAKSPAVSSAGSLTPIATSAAAMDMDDEEDEDDDSQVTPTKSRLAVQVPSVKLHVGETPATPTAHSRKLLAGLDLENTQDDAAASPKPADAVNVKMAELQASGWRPEEELVGASAEDDDEDYAGVDLISQSDEDDAAIRATENKLFKDPEMSLMEQDKNLARRLSLSDDGDDEVEWNGFEESAGPTFADSFLIDQPNLPSFMLKEDDDSDFARESRSFADAQRKVRFEDEVDAFGPSSDSDQSEDDFPDIFTDFALKPYYTKNHDEDIEEGSDAGSVWDFEGDDMNLDDDDDDDTASLGSNASSSGYDSDDGETTDEEECQPIKRPSPAPAQSATASTPGPKSTDTAATKKHATRSKAPKPTTPAVHHTPKFGTFELDPRRNVLIVSGAGVTQKNKLYPAKIQTPHEKRIWQKLRETYKNSTASPRTSVQMGIEDDSDYEMEQSIFSPSGPFSPSGTLMADDIIGPIEAYTPFTSVDASGFITEDASMQSFSEEEEDDPMDLLSPYINFDAHDDDEEEEEEDNSADMSDGLDAHPRRRSHTLPGYASSSADAPATPSLNRQGTGNSDFSGVAHLSITPSLVGSFRLNQEYAKEMASLASDPNARFSRSEMNAMQAGRRKAANTPITPMRKKRGGSLSKIGNVSWSKGLNLDKDLFLSDSKKKPSQHQRRPSSGRGVGRMGKGVTFR